MASKRKNIPAATEAALWALSNGHCYAPARLFPMIFEVDQEPTEKCTDGTYPRCKR